jgi:hypothetical protein
MQITYEKIHEKYFIAKYSNLECVINMETGYINATEFCSTASKGKKHIKTYLDSKRYKDLIAEYTKNGSSSGNRQIINEGESIVVYFHPNLFLDLASWVSDSAYVKASRIITDFLLMEIMKRDEEIRSLKK